MHAYGLPQKARICDPHSLRLVKMFSLANAIKRHTTYPTRPLSRRILYEQCRYVWFVHESASIDIVSFAERNSIGSFFNRRG